MNIEHLLEAIRATALVNQGVNDEICDALRGIIARASRYAANEPKEICLEDYVKQIVKSEIDQLLK